MIRINNIPILIEEISEDKIISRQTYKLHCCFSSTTFGPMRPQSLPLHCAAFPNSTTARRTHIGTRYITTATQTTPLRCETRRPILQTARSRPQVRCISQGFLKRMEEGRKEWARHAEEIKAGKRKDFATHLEERGLIHDVVGYGRSFGFARLCMEGFANLSLCSERELLHRVFTEKRAGIYVGIDPTAPSMHVGHMLPFMVLAWAYVWGLPVTFLVR